MSHYASPSRAQGRGGPSGNVHPANRTLAKKSGCKGKRGGTYRRQITLGESFLESRIRMGIMPNKHPCGPAKQYCRKKEMEPQSENMEEQLISDNHLPQGTEKYLMK